MLKLFRGAGRGVELSIDGDEYRLGEAIEARVTVSEAAASAGGSARIELLYRNTYSRGTLQLDVGDTPVTTNVRSFEDVVVATYPVPVAPGSHPARIELPLHDPPTFLGLVSWSVHLVLEGPGGRTTRKRTRMQVLAPRDSFVAHASLPGWCDPRCPMTISGVERSVAAGEPVSGILSISPHEPFDAKGVRMTLRPWYGTAELLATGKSYGGEVPSKVKLAGESRFRAGERYDFPFELPAVSASRPSLESKRSTAIWFLEGVLPRGFQVTNDYRVRLPMHVYNG